MNKISDDAKKILENIKHNKKYKFDILETYYGMNAIKEAKKFFFPFEKEQAQKWAKKWNNYEKSKSVFIVYSRKLKVNTYVYYKFIIGEGNNLSVLGEKIIV